MAILTAEVLEQRAKALSQPAEFAAETAHGHGPHAHLFFRCGGETLALPLTRALEILPAPAVTRIPGAPDEIAGVINVRGTIVDVIRVGRLLDLPSGGPCDPAGRRVILCEAEGSVFGLEVDGVTGIQSIPPEELLGASDSVLAANAAYLAGVARTGPSRPKLVSVLDVSRVLDSPRFDSVRGTRAEPEPSAR
jgi:purine-binding chemotaxis protein CheW